MDSDFKNKKILVVDDESSICEILSGSLEDEGFEVETAQSGAEALNKIPDFKPDIMLLDVWMPGDYDGIEVLEKIKKETKAPIPSVIVMSGHGTIETAVKAVKLGAWDFIEKPISMEKILITIKNMLNYSMAEKERVSLLNQLKESYLLEGSSEHMQLIKSLVMKFGKSNSPFLITGEEGVGKALIARNIHFVSSKASGPFYVLNCKSIPQGLQSHEIFGDSQSNKGRLNSDLNGTLLLKNIECLDTSSQDSLIDYLRSFAKDPSKNSTRLIATTTQDLNSHVQKGSFREDLFVKLSNMKLEVLPLRDRMADVPTLFESFSHDQARKSGVNFRKIQDTALKKLMNYRWPGNVGELKNFVERLYILSQNDVFDLYDLTYAGLKMEDESVYIDSKDFREARSEFEKEYLKAKLKENNGNISKTSESIGLERSYLHRKIKSYGIEV